ncbi:alpha--glucanase [Moniliophthora roreri]|nr:alpha--glucanase [Moniliophthora roreri]
MEILVVPFCALISTNLLASPHVQCYQDDTIPQAIPMTSLASSFHIWDSECGIHHALASTSRK